MDSSGKLKLPPIPVVNVQGENYFEIDLDMHRGRERTGFSMCVHELLIGTTHRKGENYFKIDLDMHRCMVQCVNIYPFVEITSRMHNPPCLLPYMNKIFQTANGPQRKRDFGPSITISIGPPKNITRNGNHVLPLRMIITRLKLGFVRPCSDGDGDYPL
ncbi:hypothetical protein PHJA_000148500 [Phtheirospermum japonicum]|uniref:Uncharacterized protein n=1 Tax=Phtheirospermum japonicum TaxID=374723 RepID=A0A830BDA1_9LAMI|nr:hypothetical protein PHJA_000148500 [Phtheirospermum japonicum]